MIEEVGSDKLEPGIQIEVFNSLGAGCHGLTDGGAQERSLVNCDCLKKEASTVYPPADRYDQMLLSLGQARPHPPLTR